MALLRLWGEFEAEGIPRSRLSNMLIIQGVAVSPDGTIIVINIPGFRDLDRPGDSLQLFDSDAGVLVNNSSAVAISLVPPAQPQIDQQIIIADGLGTAGLYPISLTGTVNGVVNPVLVDVAFESAKILFRNGLIYRLR